MYNGGWVRLPHSNGYGNMHNAAKARLEKDGNGGEPWWQYLYVLEGHMHPADEQFVKKKKIRNSNYWDLVLQTLMGRLYISQKKNGQKSKPYI